MEKKKSANAGILAVFVKLGLKLVTVFTKLLKSAKVVKIGLATASAVSYAYLFTWKFALLIMVMLFVHESGHVWAMKRKGIKTKGFYFIPLIGGAAVPEESFRTRRNESYIAVMGPVWGLLLSTAVLGIYYLTNNSLFAAGAGWIALINLLNLIPVNPLDGGRITKSLVFSLNFKSESTRKGAILTLNFISAAILVTAGIMKLWLFFILGCVGLLEIIFELRKPSDMKKMTSSEMSQSLLSYFVVAALLYGVMYFTQHIPGSHLAMQVITDKKS